MRRNTLITIIITIAFGPHWCIGCLQQLSRHPDPGSASQVIIIIIIIIIIITIIITIAFGPYWSIGRLQELSRHPDPWPVSPVVIIIIIIIIIIAFGPYWSIGRLQELSRHPDPWPVSPVVPRCNPSYLFQPPDRGARCFFSGLIFSFPVGSRLGLDMQYAKYSKIGNC